MLEMFKGVANSPETTITNNISNSDTLIYVLDETRIPEPPNLMVLGTGVGAETIKVLSIEGNAITVERGFQGVAKAWNAGTIIARNFTEYDYNALVENVKTLKGNTDTNADDILSLMNYVGNLENLDTVEKSNIVLALNEIYNDLVAHKADYASLFLTNADAKNSIYRGKYLGNTVTEKQYADISNGTFEDMYIGDYWTMGGINWRIAAFNYYRNTGDTLVPGNHITIVPDTQLYTHAMNDTNITTGGYTGSKMYTVGLEQAKTTIRGIFGTHLLNIRRYLSNAATDGASSGGAWFDSDIELMNEIMVYGSRVNGSTIRGLYDIGTEKSQLPLFALNPRMINTRQSYWLRDVNSAAHFAYVDGSSFADYSNASNAYGVRPAFSIS